MDEYLKAYHTWRADPYFDKATREELAALTDAQEIEDRFYSELTFGTGGLRGEMGAGTNRMNRYIIGKATQGLADYLKAIYPNDAEKSVAIAYDSRNHSATFAMQAALTLCANGIGACLFDTLMPTPVLSFTVRHLGCAAGIVITASHNPKEYNGYKVYDRDGCQLVPHKAEEVMRYIDAVALTSVRSMDETGARHCGLLKSIGSEILDAFINAILEQAHPLDVSARKALRIIYTPLHGTGNLPVQLALSKLGFDHVTVVPGQQKPDGDFPTVSSPNPEDRAALTLGIALAMEQDADLVMGTDPDCDRVGVAVRADDGYQLITGNQMGALLVYYVLMRRKDRLSADATLVKTVVTSELGAEIGKSYGLKIVDTLTGFKFIGEKICQFERDNTYDFVIGYEESYGYLVGTHARDKDAVVSSMLICEMAAYYKAQGKTLIDILQEIYAVYGYYLDEKDSFTLKGRHGSARMGQIMSELRATGVALTDDVAELIDYSQGVGELPKANVLKFRFHGGSWLAVRPSGTEPKIKVYYSIRQQDQASAAAALEKYRAVIRSIVG